MRRYGEWAGNPKGYPEVVTRCVESVMDAGGYIGKQCDRKRGHGLDGLYCKQHARRHPAEITDEAQPA